MRDSQSSKRQCHGILADVDICNRLKASSWARLEGKFSTTPERIVMHAVHRIKQISGRRQYTKEYERTNQAIMATAGRYSSNG